MNQLCVDAGLNMEDFTYLLPITCFRPDQCKNWLFFLTSAICHLRSSNTYPIIENLDRIAGSFFWFARTIIMLLSRIVCHIELNDWYSTVLLMLFQMKWADRSVAFPVCSLRFYRVGLKLPGTTRRQTIFRISGQVCHRFEKRSNEVDSVCNHG